MSDFHGVKYKRNLPRNQDPVQSMHTNFSCKSNSFEDQKSSGRPQKLSKIRKKLVTCVLNEPTSSLERIEVAHKLFSCYDTMSRVTVRQITSKYGVFQEMLQKKSV